MPVPIAIFALPCGRAAYSGIAVFAGTLLIELRLASAVSLTY
jgi:hypothetical protein